MNQERTPLRNGLLFGSVSGLFGGFFWTLIVSLPPDEALVAARWIVICGGFLFWFLVGFLAGVFNAPGRASRVNLATNSRISLVQRLLVAIGWLLYRLLVGGFVGVVATLLFSVVSFNPFFAVFRFVLHLDEEPSGRFVMDAMASGVMTAVVCGFSGSVFAVLMVTRRSPFDRPVIGSRAVRGCFLSFLMGIPIGTALGWLPTQVSKEALLSFSLALSVPIGILGGILGGLWTDIRRLRDSRNN